MKARTKKELEQQIIRFQNASLVTYNQGYRILKRFNGMSCHPKWESLRVGDDVFSKGDQKFQSRLEDLQNDENIDLEHYLKRCPTYRKYFNRFEYKQNYN